MTELIIMVGLPGSGKSVFVNDHIIKRGFNEGVYGYHVISRDDVRLAFGYKFSHLIETNVLAVVKTMVRALMIRGINIVLDETNTHISTINMWKGLAEEYGYKTRAIVMTTPIDICKERRKVSEGEFPEDVIDRMYEQMSVLVTDVLFNDSMDKIEFYNSNGEVDSDYIRS